MQRRQKQLEIDQSTQDPKDPEFSLLAPEKKQVIKAIKKLKYKVTPADLASNSGLSINVANFWLNKVAGETKAKLEVSADGTVFYSFAPDFTNAYLQRGFRKTLLIVGSVAFQILYWAIRMSFGVALILSILIIIVLFVLMILAAFGDSGGGDSGGGGDGFFDPGFVFDLFRWDYCSGSTYYPNSAPSSTRDKNINFRKEHPKGNFFLEVFSFLFGDGAPNSNLQEIRWQQIARVIKQNGGVVSTEQLAPFLDGDSSDSGMILSALAQFNGRPEVTKSGFIVYVFPDFLDESVAPARPPMRVDNYLKEDYWRFTAFPPEAWIKVLILAGLNFWGSWWLFKHIATVALLQHVVILIDVLLTYATVFLAIPAIRFLVLLVLNQRVTARNDRRKAAWNLVDRAEGDILKEIIEAREIRQEELSRLHTDRSIVYSSERDLLEQEFEQKPPTQNPASAQPLRTGEAENSEETEAVDIKQHKPQSW